ncbi:putative GTP binding translation elongation/initiation factor [Megavirus courdo11]|uniref:Putative GTP binding translation elongation/initiation factor n=2 Tax=Megavirus chilense TaxID=3060301 RepID=K7Y9W9_9VIRU
MFNTRYINNILIIYQDKYILRTLKIYILISFMENPDINVKSCGQMTTDKIEVKNDKINNDIVLDSNVKIESAKFVVVGNVDAGKSSFIGVMKSDILDDGNGLARSYVAKLKHEIETGRTSTQTSHYIVQNNEITTLIDLCGHEKYLKTTMFGVTGMFADFGILVIGANMEIRGMTLEHIKLLNAMGIPYIIIVTKIDICPENVMASLKRKLTDLSKKCKKQIIYFQEEQKEINDSHKILIEGFQSKKAPIMPVIMISNKTGFNIDFTRKFITSIKSRSYLDRMGLIKPIVNEITKNYPPVMYIDSTFNVHGTGIVLSGTCKYGSFKKGQRVYLGPINNTYIPITIKSIHNCISDNVDEIHKNESGSMGIRLDSKGSYTKEMFSKGQIVTTDIEFAKKNTCYTFNCDISIFNHPTTIMDGYQTVVHCRTIRQSGRFKLEENTILRSNSRTNLNIKFVRKPEFILPGTIIMIREGNTKGMGKIRFGIPYTEDTPEIMKKTKKSARLFNFTDKRKK